jgi:outer membrane protein OmpA-like peptidoglycan-associated protein
MLSTRVLPLVLALMVSSLVTPTLPAIAAPIDHPLIKPYEGSSLTRRDDAGHAEYKVVTGLDQAGKTDDDIILTTKVAGNLTRLFYENPDGKSPLEIITNYRQALEAAGFTILFNCGDKECGPSWASSRWGRVNGMKYVSSPMWFVSAKRLGEKTETYVAISAMKARHEINVLEAKAMETGLVTVTAEALRKGLAADGRVVLSGLYFDTDKATLKAESKPALDVIGAFLQGDPGLNVYIVGHTDMAGTHEHNMSLSQARAKSVVDALVADYKIAASRLAAHGVGPLCPTKTNDTESGKAGNRRVEMVARKS